MINLDAWVSNYMRSAGYEARIEYDTKVLENMWENAIDETMADALGLPVDFIWMNGLASSSHSMR